MSEDTELLPEARLKAADVQATCASISTLIIKLPNEEAKIINDALASVRAKMTSELESYVPSLFVWDNLPGEVKNAVYRSLLVSDKPIKACVSNPLVAAKRSWKSHSLHGHVLRLSKTIYQEALPILLGDNTFELNSSLDPYLGFGLNRSLAELTNGVGTTPQDRATMVRKLVVEAREMPETFMRCLRRLKNLQELTFVAHTEGRERASQMKVVKWEKKCASRVHLFEQWALMKYVLKKPELSCYLVSYQVFDPDTPQVRTNTRACWT